MGNSAQDVKVGVAGLLPGLGNGKGAAVGTWWKSSKFPRMWKEAKAGQVSTVRDSKLLNSKEQANTENCGVIEQDSGVDTAGLSVMAWQRWTGRGGAAGGGNWSGQGHLRGLISGGWFGVFWRFLTF